jgi:hypothetical protein
VAALVTALAVELEPDPTLLARQFGLQLAQSINARPELAASMHGAFALISTTGNQALTVAITSERVYIERGNRNADVQVFINFDQPESARPSLLDMCRHPVFCMNIFRLLKPVSIRWEEIADTFWESVAHNPDAPQGLRLVNSDDEHSVELGCDPIELTLRGTSQALGNLLSGKSILLYDVLTGAISARGSLKHLSVVSDASTAQMLGINRQVSEQRT